MTTRPQLSIARRIVIGGAVTFAALSQNVTIAQAQVVIGSQRTVETPVAWQSRAARLDSTHHSTSIRTNAADASAPTKPSFSVAMRGFFRRRGPRGARMGGGGMGQVGVALGSPLRHAARLR